MSKKKNTKKTTTVNTNAEVATTRADEEIVEKGITTEPVVEEKVEEVKNEESKQETSTPDSEEKTISVDVETPDSVENSTTDTTRENVTESKEEPKIEQKPVVTEPPKVEEPKKETPKPVETSKKEVKKDINLSTTFKVRFAQVFSSKRIAFEREMNLYNMLYTSVHNHAVFMGLVNSDELEIIRKFIFANTIKLESLVISDVMKEDIFSRLKSDTSYVTMRWGKK